MFWIIWLEQFRPTKSEAKSYFIAGDDIACQEVKEFTIALTLAMGTFSLLILDVMKQKQNVNLGIIWLMMN